MPEPGRGREEDERGPRPGRPPERTADGRRAEKGRDPVSADRPGQPAEERHERLAQPEERRRGHHEQQVLHHVDLQQQRRERLDRRPQRQEHGRQAGEEGEHVPRLPPADAAAAQGEPAAQVEARRQQERGEQPRVKRPGEQKRIDGGVHDPSPAGSRPEVIARRGSAFSLPACGEGPGWGCGPEKTPPTLTLPHKGGGNRTASSRLSARAASHSCGRPCAPGAAGDTSFAGRAGATLAGRRLTRNAVTASISDGLICLP